MVRRMLKCVAPYSAITMVGIQSLIFINLFQNILLENFWCNTYEREHAV